jgi:hypothetical protein
VETAEASVTLKVAAVFTSVLEAYPAEITQRENQFMRLVDNHYFYSPYTTETQKTTFKVGYIHICTHISCLSVCLLCLSILLS